MTTKLSPFLFDAVAIMAWGLQEGMLPLPTNYLNYPFGVDVVLVLDEAGVVTLCHPACNHFPMMHHPLTALLTPLTASQSLFLEDLTFRGHLNRALGLISLDYSCFQFQQRSDSCPLRLCP